MYETFKVPGLYIANPAFLSLYCAGKFTGVSIDSGENITMINTFFEGCPFSISRLNLAGKDLTE
jgi:actin-related protein